MTEDKLSIRVSRVYEYQWTNYCTLLVDSTGLLTRSSVKRQMGLFSKSKQESVSEVEEDTDSSLPSYAELFGNDSDVIPLLQQHSRHLLDITYRYAGKFTTDLNLQDTSSGQVLYFAEIREWKKKPDLILRQDGPNGSVIGTCSYRYKSNIEMSLNGDTDEQSNQVVVMESSSRFTSIANQYSFSMPSQSAVSGLRNIQIVRTNKKEDGVTGWKSKLAWYNYKIMDLDSNQPIGLWLEQTGLSFNRGKLRLQVKTEDGKPVLDEQELRWMLLALSGLVDKIRRAIQQNGAIAASNNAAVGSSTAAAVASGT